MSTMKFRTLNKFNVVLNIISGHFFPVSETETDGKFIRDIYAFLTWLFLIIYWSSTTVGLTLYMPAFVAIQTGAASTVSTVEMVVLSGYLTRHHRELRDLIGKFESVLVDSDDLRRCISENVEPYKQHLKIYTIAVVGSVILWASAPILEIFGHQRSFGHEHFVMPTYLPGLPFDAVTFTCATVVEAIGVTYMITKKVAIDIYVNYLITLLTAQYYYVHDRMSKALRRNDFDRDAGSNDLAINSLKKCVQHHCAVIGIGQMLRKLLAIYVGITYICSILRLCFLSFFIIGIPGAYFEKCMYMGFMMGIFIQVYMFCSCCQELIEASTSVMDGAFHEDWYGRGTNVKRMFRTICLSGHMECRLSAWRIVDLTVPTLVAMLNQAYSICLLLLKVK